MIPSAGPAPAAAAPAAASDVPLLYRHGVEVTVRGNYLDMVDYMSALEAINNFVFGEMWGREGLDQRSRRWLTLVGVAESCAPTI